MRRAAIPGALIPTLLLLLLAAASLPAQQPAPAPEEPPAAGAAPAPDAAAPAAPEADELLQRTRELDIRTASYYELLAWCRQLGLAETGGRAELQARLLQHYGLAAGQEGGGGEAGGGGGEAAGAAGAEDGSAADGGRNLQIESARETEYFTLEQVDESYVVLRGGVRILLREGEALHTIQAERVTLNQTENLLTAEGDVEYTMTRGERTDRFSGDSLTFNTRSLEGVFFEGGTESDQQVDGETIRFRFLGDAITRLENSTVIMERARITSSKPVDPYYQIRARKVWILASGEWAVLGALLYVGRIPVIYLPFFFYPGEEFFFHPVIGTRDREGSFLQTTTYLLGQKKRSSTPLSILSLDAPQENQTLRRRRGLFLREVPGRTVDEEDLDRYLTVMADVYSRLGAFAGVKGSFPPEVSFSGGIGFSRSIFTGAGGAYTPYFEDPPGEYRTFWNESRLLGLDLPFRYGIDSTWLLGGSRFSLSGRFEAYSDPFFPSDFFDRAEELDWSGLLGLQGGSGLQDTSTEKLNLTWELTAKADLSSLFASPFFQTVSLQYLQARMLWQSFSRDVSADPLLAADPARRFYYPVSLQAPSVSLNLTGELLRVSSSGGIAGGGAAGGGAAGRGAAGGPAEAGYRAPAEGEDGAAGGGAAIPEGPQASGAAGGGAAEGAGEAESPAEAAVPRLPGAQEDLPLRAEREDFSFRLGYQIRPDLIVEQLFDPAGWTTPEAVDYDVLYTTLRLTDTAALNYELSAVRELLGLTGSFTAATTWRDRFRGTAPADAAWETLVVGDLRQTRTDLSSAFSLSLQPMLDLPGWERSRLTYSLNWIFLSHELVETATIYENPRYRVTGLEWSTDTVRNNRLQASLEYRPEDVSHTLTLTADLPPFVPSLTGRLQFTTWLLTTTASTVLREEDDAWILQPLVIQETLNLSDRFQAVEELRFDLQAGRFLKSVSSLAWGGFTASLSAERLPPVEFDDTEGEWVETGEPDRVQLSQLRLGWELQPKASFFWRNRIWIEPRVDASYTINLTEFTENSLDFIFGFRFFIHRFMEFSVTSTSSNGQTYRWFPAAAESVGVTPVNPFLDLLRSFNFFNRQDRLDSGFKLRSISLQAVHHLHDWDLTVTYEGLPNLFSNSLGQLRYRWENTLVILLQWVPLPPVRSRVWLDSTGFYVRS